jgi:hypothetical protein
MGNRALRGVVLAGAAACLLPGGSTRAAGTGPPECAAVVALLDAQYAMYNAFVDADAAALIAGLETVPVLVVFVSANPPDDIAPSVEIWLNSNVETFRLLHGLTDPNAIFAALANAPPAPMEVPQAQRAVEAWAQARCGWTVPATDLTPTTVVTVATTAPTTTTTIGPLPEPADCALLDPVVAVEAAGADIDAADADGVFDGGGPAFRTRACSYGDGAMYLTTVSFNDIDAASEMMIGMATTVGGGEVVDVDVGALPESTVVVRFGNAVQVVVFDAEVPFAVTIGGVGVDPAIVVSAAQALDVSLSAPSPETSTSPPG